HTSFSRDWSSDVCSSDLEPVFFESIIESVGPVEIVPGLLPLEVGYTDGSRTLLHFAQERGVARWPYGSDTIYLYKVIDDTLWTRSEERRVGREWEERTGS